MRLPIFALPVLSAILACGPGQPAETTTDAGSTTTPSEPLTDTEPATTSTATTGTATTESPTVTSITTITTEAVPTTSVETGEPTTDPVETSTGTTTADPSTGTTDETTTGGPPDVAFAAQFWAGGLDHLQVRMAALKDDFCVEIQFARPGDVGPAELSLPTDWWYQGATASPGAADCLDFMAPMQQAIGAESVAGVATWDDQPFCPSAIDTIDIVLGFPPGPPWLPGEVQLLTDAIPVGGC